MNASKNTIVIYGGNGFVGCAIAKSLVESGANVICVSRRGDLPQQLKQVTEKNNTAWAQRVKWLCGDAEKPDIELLKSADVVVTVVGSAPLPTFSKSAYREKVHSNGYVNVALFDAARAAGVKRVVLMSAHIPALLRRHWFGYYQGKKLAQDAAKSFAAIPGCQAFILFPFAIYGVRYLENGQALRLELFLRPLASMQRMIPKALCRFLPEQLVSVDEVAMAVKRALMSSEALAGVAECIDNVSICDA